MGKRRRESVAPATLAEADTTPARGWGAAPPLALPDDGALVPVEADAEVAAAEDEADDDRVERLSAALGVRFADPGLLRVALTHRSILHYWADAGVPAMERQSNERLEFLGDAVLGAIVARELYDRDPAADEGALTSRRVTLVRAETLVRWARAINLADYLYLGHGERVTAGARDRMLAGAFEALVGAIYLDRGVREARRFVRRFLREEDEPVVTSQREINPKGHLQEVLQERFRLGPTYHTLATAGPAHARVFTVEVSLAGRLLGMGHGGSKRDAEQNAARAALVALAASAAPDGDDGALTVAPPAAASAGRGSDG